jgi:malonyl-CoA O-methyltransferase
LQTQGVSSTRNDLRHIKSLLSQATYSLEGLQQGLAWLASYDLLSCWDALTVPTLHQFGARDNLVPHDAASLVADRYPNRALKVFQASAHLPFITERESWLASTVDFIRANSLQAIKKNDIEKSFSSAAKNYDSLAVFQHQVGRQLMNYLQANSARRVLDLGAGTGYFSESLRAHYSAADIVELDISPRMLASCQERAVSDFQVQADIEALPFEQSSFDIVFSNLSIQWCHDLDNVFKGLADILVDGGTAVLTTLVDGSLFELKQAWSNVDDAVHVNIFDNELKIKTSCEQSGLKLQHWLVEDDVQTFLTLQDLIQSVKNIGAHNMHPNRPKGLMGKNKYRQFVNAYSALQTSKGELPLTYRVLYMVLKK